MSELPTLTQYVRAGHDLSPTHITTAVAALLDDTVGATDKAEFLTALAHKGETVAEIAGFARELRARAVDPQIDPAMYGGVLLDVVGTGADQAHTFNVSTCVVFIAAAAGVAVAKHGNRAVTSKCGSADVLAALGANVELPPEAARRCLAATGLTFLFAPLYHPAFKAIAPVRKQLAERGQRTVFNILGPLVNPARPTHQLLGVFDAALVRRYAEAVQLLGVRHALVVHGAGLDEFTILGRNQLAEVWGPRIELSEKWFPYQPSDVQLRAPDLASLAGGDADTNARILRNILSNADRGPKRDLVLLNAAAALVVAEKVSSYAEGWELAAKLIDSGAALAKLEAFVAASRA